MAQRSPNSSFNHRTGRMTISELTLATRAFSKKRILLATGVLVLAVVLRDHLLAASLFALANLWQIAP